MTGDATKTPEERIYKKKYAIYAYTHGPVTGSGRHQTFYSYLVVAS